MSEKSNRREFMHAAGLTATSLLAPVHPLFGTGAEPQVQTTSRISMGARFRDLLRGPEPTQCIGVYDAVSARLAEIEGFKSVFAGGTSTALNHALPDWGLTTSADLLEFASHIAANVDIPVLADGDGESPLHVYRVTKAFERAGIAAVKFEDRIRADRIGQSADVIPKLQMVDRIRAAADARSDLVIVVRSDALSANRSMEETLERLVAYAEAGADVVGPFSMRLEDYPRAAELVKKPLYAPFSESLVRMKEARVGLVLYTLTLQNIAQGAVHKALLELKNTGAMIESAKMSLPRDVAEKLTRNQEIMERATKFNVGR